MVFAAFVAQSQIQLNWSTPINVAPGFDNLRPRIVLTDGDVPVVMWGTATGPVYTARWNGTSFDAPVEVIIASLNPYCTNWTGPDMAVDGNNVWVVADCEFGSDFRVYTVKSTDGGVTFGDTVIASGYSGLTRFSSIEASNGNPTVAFMNHNAGWTVPDYTIANSIDGGDSYLSAVSGSNSLTGNEVCDCCPPELAISGNKQAVMFRNNDNNLRDIWASFSIDNGSSFTIGNDIDDNEWNIMACPSSGADGFFRGDSLISTWMSAGEGFSRIYLNSTSSVNANATPAEMVSPIGSTFPQNYPRIDGDETTFGIVFQQSAPGGSDIYMAVSTQGLTAIDSTNILVNQVTTGGQTTPDIAYSNGIFHIVYADDFTNNVVYLTAQVGTVSVGNEMEFGEIQVYPNPVSNSIYIDQVHSEGLTYELCDLKGDIVLSGELNAFEKNEIVCDFLISGQYVMNIYSVNKAILGSEKIVISH